MQKELDTGLTELLHSHFSFLISFDFQLFPQDSYIFVAPAGNVDD